MKWIRLWPDYIINGTTFDELDAEVRGVWFSFLALAGYSPFPGVICIAKGVPYTREQISAVIKIEVSIVNRAIDRMAHPEVKKIILNQNGTISIANWNKYQTEYERQKPYRKGLHGKVTQKGYKQTLRVDTETDTDTEEDKDKKRKKRPYPTLSEAILYFNDMKYFNPQTEGEKFWNYYESNGWRVGKNKMRSWHNAAAGWNTRAKERPSGTFQSKGRDTFRTHARDSSKDEIILIEDDEKGES